MVAVVFGSLLLATAVRDRMNVRAGLPIPGVDGGGGRHVPAALSATTRVSPVRRHATLTSWCVHVNRTVILIWWRWVKSQAQARIDAGTPQAGDTQIVATTAQTLDGTWATATEVA